METFSALLAICAGISPVPGEFPAQRAVTRSFDVFFDLHPNKRLSKPRRGGDLRRYRAPFDVTVMWHRTNPFMFLQFAWYRTISCDIIVHNGSLMAWYRQATYYYLNQYLPRSIWPQGPLARYEKMWVVHAPVMPGTFSRPPSVAGKTFPAFPTHRRRWRTTGLRCCTVGRREHTGRETVYRWREKRSRHSRRMRNLQFYESGKRPMAPVAQLAYAAVGHCAMKC